MLSDPKLAAILILLLAPLNLHAADPPKGYVASKTKTPIAIDGKLDDSSWAAAPWTDDFQDIEGDAKKPRPRFRTRVKMLWDDQYFYVGAELMEPHVWATLTKHDSVIFHDNDFEVFIDPDGDNQEYYEIEINPLNTEWDLFLKKAYRNGGPAINEWEIPGLKTATHINGTINDPSEMDISWTVEFAFPWKVLAEYAHRPCPPRNGDQWRVNFSRVEWQHTVEGKTYKKVPNTPEANWVWSPQGLIDMHQPEHWGFVQFSDAPPGSVRYQPDPAQAVRDRLMEVYRAQGAYHGKTKEWATSLEALGLKADSGVSIDIGKTPTGYVASGSLPDRRNEVWTIREDSQLTRKGVAR